MVASDGVLQMACAGVMAVLKEVRWHFQFVCRSLIADLTPVASNRPRKEAANGCVGASGTAVTLSAFYPRVVLSLRAFLPP